MEYAIIALNPDGNGGYTNTGTIFQFVDESFAGAGGQPPNWSIQQVPAGSNIGDTFTIGA